MVQAGLRVVSMLGIIGISILGTAWAQTTPARIGVYFFGGWRPGDTVHVTHLLTTQFPERMPARGWFYSSWGDVAGELKTAKQLGVDFVAFDWYPSVDSFTARRAPELNWAFNSYLSSDDTTLPRFAVLIVNHQPYAISAAHWPDVARTLARRIATRADRYLVIDGRIVLTIFDPYFERDPRQMNGLNERIATLRAALANEELPEAWIGACVNERLLHIPAALRTLQRAGYDFATAYHYTILDSGYTGVPFARLIAAQENTWRLADSSLAIPYAPVITTGWDPRPWRGMAKTPYYAAPTDSDWTALGTAFTEWQSRRSVTSPLQQLVFIYSWNETAEESALVPRANGREPHARALLDALTAGGR